MSKIPAIILSGGSEIVSIAIAEELISFDIPVVVISLKKPSILKKSTNNHQYFEIDWPPINPEKTKNEILNILETLGAGKPEKWPIFATEDGGLRLLFEYQTEFNNYTAIPSAKKLSMGGLDKAEFFHLLDNQKLSQYYPLTKVVDSPSSTLREIKNWNENLVLKPSIKPFSMLIKGLESKILVINKENDKHKLAKKLEGIWENKKNENWILQEKIDATGTEKQWYGTRNCNNDILGMTASEKLKYPLSGGSGCWVESKHIKEINSIAKKILNVTEVVGCAEISFLDDKNDHPLLLELNPRFWLQIALAKKSGFPIVFATYNILTGNDTTTLDVNLENKTWVNIERMILSFIKKESSLTAMELVNAVKDADYIAGYSSNLKGVTTGWMKRMSQNTLRSN